MFSPNASKGPAWRAWSWLAGDAAARAAWQAAIRSLGTQHSADDFKQQAALGVGCRQLWEVAQRLAVVGFKQGDVQQLIQGDQAGTHAVVDVMGVVGNFVG